MSVLFTDDFLGTNADLGVAWDRYSSINGLQRISDLAEAEIVNAAVDCIESHSGTLPNDQWAEAVLATIGPATEYNALGIGLRWAAPSTVSGYLLLLDSASDNYRLSVQKYAAGVLSTVASSPSTFVTVTLLGNDAFRLEAIGTLLRGFQNGVQILTGTDSAFASGRAALDVYPTTNLANAAWNSFASGDFTLPPYQPWHQLAPLLAH